MHFREALSVLSKSSPYAVSTEKELDDSNILNQLKDYLYITTDIEKDFRNQLGSLSLDDKKIIFLCGSSGDGKSEILTRYKRDYEGKINFHLDATHSFKPAATAIETLDELFRLYDDGAKSLVVGINTGMLGNYAEEGNISIIKEFIRSFLESKQSTSECLFIDFEDYPKFDLELESYSSDFIKSFFERLTSNNKNIVRSLYEQELNSQSPDSTLCTNYSLLSIPEVQEAVIDILLKARLVKDQFLTARALLDFVFNLLAGPDYIFDNLFLDSENELSTKIIDLDPVNRRSKQIDEFVLSQHLKLRNDEFDNFHRSLVEIGIKRDLLPESFLRAFYLLRKTEIGNNYHRSFESDFHEPMLVHYSRIWSMHADFHKNVEHKLPIRRFYKESVINALHRYMNKNAPKLEKGQYLLSEHNGVQVCSEIDIQPDFEQIKRIKPKNNASFNVCLKVGNETISLAINVNLLELMDKVIQGYRPNKHDKNTVVLLDELVDKLVDAANASNTIFLINQGKRIKVSKIDDDEIEVSGV